jgi:hypothetical protein
MCPARGAKTSKKRHQAVFLLENFSPVARDFKTVILLKQDEKDFNY